MSEIGGIRSLALLRVLFGVWLLWKALPNLDPQFIENMPIYLEWYAQNNPFPWFRPLLLQWGMANVHHVSEFFVIGQLLIGSALVLGFLTRFFAIAGLVYTGVLMLCSYHMGWHFQSLGILLSLVFLTLWVGDAGRFYGLDRFLFKSCDTAAVPSKPGKSAKFKNKKQKQIVESLDKELKQMKKKAKQSKAKS